MTKLFTLTERVQVGLQVVEQEACFHPIAPELHKLIEKAASKVRVPSVRMLLADFNEEKETWEVEANKQDNRATVCLHAPAWPGSQTKLLALTKEEELLPEAHRVVRRFRDFDQAVGCTLLADWDLPTGAREYLIQMEPGAAFVVHRSGVLADDVPSMLTVRWEGRWNMSGVIHPLQALDASRYSLFVEGNTRRPSQRPPMPQREESTPSL